MTLLASNTLIGADLTSQVETLTYTYNGVDEKVVMSQMVVGSDTNGLSGAGGDYRVDVTIGGSLAQPTSVVPVSSGQSKATFNSRQFVIKPGDIIKIYLQGLPGDLTVDVATYLIDATACGVTVGGGSVPVNHDYGGTDNLAYKTADGVPIDNAEIRIYLQSDYDAGHFGNEYIKGSTTTDVNGRWLNVIMLDPGDYVVFAFRQPDYGPDIKSFTVV